MPPASLPSDAQLRIALQGPLSGQYARVASAVDAVRAAPLSVAAPVPILSRPPAGGEGRLQPTDTSCAMHVLRPLQRPGAGGGAGLCLSGADLAAFAGTPFQVLDLARYLHWEPAHGPEAQVKDQLPFDIKPHPAASTEVAQDMILRMERDMKTFAGMANNAKVCGVGCSVLMQTPPTCMPTTYQDVGSEHAMFIQNVVGYKFAISIYRSIYVCIYVSMYFSITVYLSIYPSICLSVA